MGKSIDEELQQDAERSSGVSGDKLDQVRSAVASARDLELEINSIEEHLSLKKTQLNELRYKSLPDLFMRAHVSRLDLAPRGNLPAYEAKMTDYYKANISSEWDEEERERAFDWLEKHGQGDLVKRSITLEFGLDESKLFERVYKVLAKIKGVSERLQIRRMVPWNTLTSWLKELYEDEGKELGDAELRMLGATVGRVVVIKPAKEK